MADPLPPLSLGVQRQQEIYLGGLKGRTPAQPVAPEELEIAARAVLSPSLSDRRALPSCRDGC